MRGLILAAGRGSRMGDLTEESPKCMTPLCGKTLIEWQIAALRGAGVDEIAVVRGYRPEALVAPGCAFFDNPRWSETNMVMSLAAAQEWLLEGPTVVSYSDIVYGPEAVRRLAAAPGALAITYDKDWHALWSARFDDPLSDAESFVLGPGGRLAEIGARVDDLARIEGQYMGLLKFTPEGWRQVAGLLGELAPAQADRLDMTSLLQRLLDAGVTIDTAGIDGGWCEVDAESDLRLYEKLAESSGAWSHDWRSAS